MARVKPNKPVELWDVGEGPGDPVFVYCAVESGNAVACKVGVAGNLSARLSGLQGGNWRPLSMVWAICLPDRAIALSIEAHCLAKFRPQIYGFSGPRKKLSSEWVHATPEEVFQWAKKIVGISFDKMEMVP